MMLLIQRVLKLKEEYGEYGNIPEKELKKSIGLDPDEPISRGRFVELFNRLWHEARRFSDPTSSITMEESGEWNDTGQTHQTFRDALRERILGPLEDSGLLSKER